MSLVTTDLIAVDEMRKICHALMNTKHYAKMGEGDIFAIVSKARSLNINPIDALNGGLYAVHGKVEMSAAMMNQLIRQHGHSVSRDAKSNDSICILHGKRKDNGDTWTESFSIDEAKRAGIYSEKGTWGKYPRDMLFARALSRLARQLFPDVIKGCYVEEEIPKLDENEATRVEAVLIPNTITEEEAGNLDRLLNQVPDYKEEVLKSLMDKFSISSLFDLTPELKQRIEVKALKKITEKKATELENMVEDIKAERIG